VSGEGSCEGHGALAACVLVCLSQLISLSRACLSVFPSLCRDSTWNEEYSLLFIDNPVGAGFSYTTMDSGYAVDSRHDVARMLYTCLTMFYATFPSVKSNDLYLTGESYAGHCAWFCCPVATACTRTTDFACRRCFLSAADIPAFGAFIHEQNQVQGNPQIPLRGVSIGDGWVDPFSQVGACPLNPPPTRNALFTRVRAHTLALLLSLSPWPMSPLSPAACLTCTQMAAIPALMFNLGLADDRQTQVIRARRPLRCPVRQCSSPTHTPRWCSCRCCKATATRCARPFKPSSTR
jgi:hypothetical protein